MLKSFSLDLFFLWAGQNSAWSQNWWFMKVHPKSTYLSYYGCTLTILFVHVFKKNAVKSFGFNCSHLTKKHPTQPIKCQYWPRSWCKLYHFAIFIPLDCCMYGCNATRMQSLALHSFGTGEKTVFPEKSLIKDRHTILRCDTAGCRKGERMTRSSVASDKSRKINVNIVQLFWTAIDALYGLGI